MKNFFLCILLFLISSNLLAQSFEWAISAGGSDNNDFVNAISLDTSENIYATGFFQGTTDFDPSGEELFLSSDYRATFIQKVDASQNLIWAKAILGVLTNAGNSITNDSEGNPIVGGFFQGNADFDPGIETEEVTSIGFNDAYVLKLDADGNFLWGKQIGGIANDVIYEVVVDNENNIICVGSFEGVVDFDPGIGEYNLTSSGGIDFFILKLDSDGDFIWAQSIGGTELDVAYSLCLDPAGNSYVTGSFNGTVDFDPGPDEMILNKTTETPFVLKLDSMGTFEWVIATENDGGGRAFAIALDNTNDLIVTGHFSGDVDFNPGPDAFNLSATFYHNIFVLKVDSLGSFIWAKSVGGDTSFDSARGMDVDFDNNIWITGSFQTTADFDPSGDELELESNGGRDIFVQKLDPSGGLINANHIGGVSEDFGYAISLTESSAYIGGYFSNVVDFDFSPSVYEIESNGFSDAFILKLSTCETTFNIITVLACDAYTSPSGTVYTSGGLYEDTLTNILGCDSILTIDLTIFTIDNSVSESEFMLTANQAGAVYQWVDCLNDYEPIDGATGQNYEVLETGSYAVIVSVGECVDTSECFNSLHFSIAESQQFSFTVYPNPTKNNVTIAFDQPVVELKVRVYSVSGQLIFEKQLLNQTQVNLPLVVAKGLYLLELEQGNGKIDRVKIVKE
ncbi:MAG: T9SS type A sorting domain-containing protein [Crocinitomix sp.]|nr:T9SS type A sorting domain-containing protein [Crocinitomix sp.]